MSYVHIDVMSCLQSHLGLALGNSCSTSGMGWVVLVHAVVAAAAVCFQLLIINDLKHSVALKEVA